MPTLRAIRVLSLALPVLALAACADAPSGSSDRSSERSREHDAGMQPRNMNPYMRP